MNLETNKGHTPPLVGYETYGGNYYKFHQDPKTFDEAMEICEAEGAHMSIVNSVEEADYIMKTMAKFPEEVKPITMRFKSYVLMGFHDAFKDGKFYTIDGKMDPEIHFLTVIQNFSLIPGKSLENSGYSKWRTDEPNGKNTENCGSFHISGVLNDIPCDAPLRYICEFNPVESM